LRQKKALPISFLSPIQPTSAEQQADKPFYFLSNDPKPIHNLSEFMKDLHTDMSSASDNDHTNNSQSLATSKYPSARDVSKHNWEINSNVSKSEGQITLNLDHSVGSVQKSDNENSPKFGRKAAPSRFDYTSDPGDSVSISDMNTTKGGRPSKSLLTDNLFKSMNEDDVSEGEIRFGNIFKL